VILAAAQYNRMKEKHMQLYTAIVIISKVEWSWAIQVTTKHLAFSSAETNVIACALMISFKLFEATVD